MRNTPMLIGSRAMDYWKEGRTIFDRKTDWDFICSKVMFDLMKEKVKDRPFAHMTDEPRLEWHDPDHLNNGELYDNFKGRCGVEVVGLWGAVLIAPPKLLYILKRSHAWRDRNHEKTLTHLWREELYKHKPSPNSFDEDLLKERIKLTKKAYPQGNPNLNQSVEDFFDDPVKKVFEHDWLHELYAYDGVPMYTKLQPDPSKAWCAKDKWDQLAHYEKLYCVAEETYVIATERFMVPRGWKYPAPLAYYKALNKVCTTLCSGWFRDFAIDNYGPIMDLMEKKRFEEIRRKIGDAKDKGEARYA
ncbi:hypothetical protein KNU84_gp036 [Bacteriophage DSS3_VP1]|uniref:DUF7275 domain-containing protein n=1 Tax=Bacteriophage DSS3_VP1 TaxID=2664196 RepID=A0A7S5FXF8_9CAUD|nr:hypothetical protein KNU84_gp036 [Bacteriophage DSS3_VP1]QGH74668.1 hypothetical protein DSS3VP1_00100 [Bacteriophage DSS3_VP1]